MAKLSLFGASSGAGWVHESATVPRSGEETKLWIKQHDGTWIAV